MSPPGAGPEPGDEAPDGVVTSAAVPPHYAAADDAATSCPLPAPMNLLASLLHAEKAWGTWGARDGTALALFTLGHLVFWSQGTWAGGTLIYHAWMFIQFLGMSAFVALVFWSGPAWDTRRTAWIFCARAALFIPPNSRRLVGAPTILQRAASPGARGAVADFLRVTQGTRLLGTMFSAVFLPLPPLLQLGAQAAMLLLSTADFCSTQCLRDPLTQSRMLTVHQYLSTGLQLAFVSPEAARTLEGGVSAEARCRSVVAFTRLTLGILMPLWCVGMPRLRQQHLRRHRIAAVRAVSRAYTAGERVLRRAQGRGRRLGGRVRVAMGGLWLALFWVAVQ